MMNKLPVVFLWHMHQPEYRDPRDGVYQQPWTYLHALKDYVDMAAHLERWPEARAVVNFVPILLEQLEDYATQIARYRESGKSEGLRDAVLKSLADPGALVGEERSRALFALQRANRERMIDRFPTFDRLIDVAEALSATDAPGRYADDAFLGDLSTWYHLAWCGETLRQTHPLIASLEEQGGNFSAESRQALVELIGETIAGLFERYRTLAERGQVELSMTPYAHPIVPLLQDLRAGTESEPAAPQPEATDYPGGEDRALWHIEHGREVFRRLLRVEPAGCWPSEGAISDPTCRLLAQAGFDWMASGQQVLRNSLNHARQELHCQHRSYERPDQSIRLFFRDDGLSDRIGFDYQNWHADDAVGDLVHHLVSIADTCKHLEVDAPIVPIILDGENAWEHYPDNGFWLLDGLYKRLSDHPRLQMTTFSEYLSGQPSAVTLRALVAGSWVYGNLATWVGEAAKNRAWDRLVEAREAYLSAEEKGFWDDETARRNARQLAVCEGSDWFWWFDDDSPADAVRDFDRLFRLQLARLYELIEETPPEALDMPVCEPVPDDGREKTGGTMRRGQA
ncbi:glycoside hydrolase [Guyparkeria hydrothermalis]|uniref:glycoside hydrolase family 57 protein n=1 Tax=Guyparkeria hydrothermalis TaxID=923 RepID=UPI002020F13A|nr:glycoside hydrolase family 57 protein [Guyparkeria hydrothermalis]MCL7743987.1 glycoside hydrolase [Guyparkeria hydrothermalis]